MNNAVKDLPLYFKEIKTSIPCTGAQKRKYLKELEFSIQEYQASHPQASLADIEQQFGTAEEISSSFLSEENPAKLKRLWRTRVWFRRIVATVICALCILLGVLAVLCYQEVYSAKHGYYVETVYTTPPVVLPSDNTIDANL